ncbi:MAG: histidine kinase dimerization/phospho-acceptor domain-containing protein, partial [Peptostreptococcaceae bacterium]
MKRILTKWDNTSIKYKLFLITSGLLVALAIIIYLILSNSLPSYYHQYKIQSLEAELNTLIEESVSHDTKELEVNLYHLVKRQNIALLLTSPSGRIVYGNNEILLLKLDKYKERRLVNISKNNKNNNSSKEYYTSRYILTNDIKTPYKLDILMPLQPVDEASLVIKKIMPYILLVAVFIGMIGAFIYSSTVTKPLIEIIESEREQEQRRRDFIATISHELKTPITIISGQIEGMMYNIGKYKDRDTYLQKSYESTQELKDLVNEMIEVSKAEIIKQDLSL